MKKSLLGFCSFFALSIFVSSVVQAAPIDLTLTRNAPRGNGVTGTLTGDGIYYDTIENLEKIIPARRYDLSITWSRKFGRNAPEIMNVPPARTGIRIHYGTKPEHSDGCVLVTDRDGEADIKAAIERDARNGRASSINII